MAWKSESERHQLAKKGIRTKEHKLIASGVMHKEYYKNCTCKICKEYNFGKNIASNWVNSGEYSEEEIKKLNNSKIIDDFMRYAGECKDYPTPISDFYKGAQTYLKDWLKYQKSHIGVI
jgi:hypothetical protein